MTNHWVDFRNADVVLIMGGNAAEAHPCGFKWVTEAKAHNNAKLIVVDPRFTRSASVADYYAPIRPGTDIVFLGGLIRWLIENEKIQREYVVNYTDLSFIVKDEFAFTEGIYSGYNAEKRSYDKSTWDYALGDDGFVKTDPSLADPRCVYQLLKQHYSRYTPEMVERVCGTPKDKVLHVWEMIASTATPTRAMTIMYALGWTQHSIGAQMIRTGAMVQLLLGNIGLAGGGMNALRGHSNIQGLTDLGLLSNQLPGYITLPSEKEQDYDGFIAARTLKPLRPNQLSYWQNTPKFHVSFMKTWWGDAATAENKWAYDYLPKVDKLYDMLQVYELMHEGKINGYICQGFNPLAAAPNKGKLTQSFSKLKFLVIMDPLATETSEFWKNYGALNDVDASKIQTEVFRLPTTCFAEENGALTNSSRWLQWHWKGAEPPGEAKSDLEIMSGIFLRMRAAYAKDGGAFPDPILNLTWKYAQPASPNPEELAREYSGAALKDLADPKDPTKITRKAGEQLAGFRRASRRRLDDERLLDLLRCVGSDRQQHGAARQRRSDRHRADAQLGIRMAREPARALQPRVVRSVGQTVESRAQADRLERHDMERRRRAGFQGRREPRERHESVHHERRRRRAFLRTREHGRRTVPRALRAIRDAAREKPAESGSAAGAQQSRRAPFCG